MSCSEATAPINITNNTNSVCNLKCAYSFKYPTSSLMIRNRGNFLEWRTDKTSMAPVIYNGQNYQIDPVLNTRLYQPSLHSYAGKKADAELVIAHRNDKSTKSLLVCIPIMKSAASSSESFTYFDMILSEVAKTANVEGGRAIFNKPTFTLAKFIPLKPYFSYKGTLPFEPCDGEYDYIVFNKPNAISMSRQALEALEDMISINKNKVSTLNTTGLFYNANGPTPPEQGDIYIDCQPTGDEGELLVPLAPESGGYFENGSLKGLWNLTIIKLIVGAIIMVLLWKMSMKVITKLAVKGTQYAGEALKKRGGVLSAQV